MSDTRYTLMFSVIQGNVLGAVIAPRGTENLPKGERMFVWRASLRPLIDELAYDDEFPFKDARKVVGALLDFCQREGLSFPVDEQVCKEAEQA